MPNSITLFKNYVPLLDEVYKSASLTGVLDGAPELAKAGANANELIIPMLDMQGLANYSRNSGYTQGAVTLTNQTVVCDYDRGRTFQVDVLDDAETAGIAFGRLSGEFIRTKVAPELDAYRISKYAATAGIGAATPANLTTGAAVIEALRAASNTMDEAEVPFENRVLFITPTVRGLVDDLDSTKSKAVLARFSQIISVPQSRMYTAITLTPSGAGGYTKKASDGKNVNFLVVHRDAAIQYQKHIAPKVITPEMNQSADAWMFGYRTVGIAQVYKNKLAGIYLHAATN